MHVDSGELQLVGFAAVLSVEELLSAGGIEGGIEGSSVELASEVIATCGRTAMFSVTLKERPTAWFWGLVRAMTAPGFGWQASDQ